MMTWFSILAALLFPLSNTYVGLAADDASDVLSSGITVSPNTLGPGQTAMVTVILRNTGGSTASVDVTVALPNELAYVPGSASTGGSYEDNAVSWNDVAVGAGATVPLTLQITPTQQVQSNTSVTIVALFMSENLHFMRFARVTLSPTTPSPPASAPNLMGSYKAASQCTLAPGEEVTYTIRLINSGTADASVTVTDVVPAPLSYVVGSATGGDTHYAAENRMLTWTLNVPTDSETSLVFVAVVSGTVGLPTLVTNNAYIAVAGNGVLQRRADVLLIPKPLPMDHRSPTVQRVEIDESDVLTGTSVTLHISATDNVSVTSMNVREWQLVTTPLPHWEIVQTSGWVPFQANYPWTLGAESGTHFVGVWVADAASNISHLDRQAMDFASLLLQPASVPQSGLVPYLVHFAAGVSVSATLTPLSGDPDLYVWYPSSFGRPDLKSTQPSTTTDTINFITPRAGTFLFMVHGYQASTYNLSITPGGGQMIVLTSYATTDKPGELSNEPVLSQSGLDPLAEPLADNLLSSNVTVAPSTLWSGQSATVKVALRNTGASDTSADVSVYLPTGLAYVPGSATGSGTPQDNTVVWNNVAVGAGMTVPLTLQFQVTTTLQVQTNTIVVAAIMSENTHTTPFTFVKLLPGQPRMYRMPIVLQ
ncbi:MAG: DUF11 domain-containing protein [Chloroflexi bacterium]|nr:DUF11 domain-containing protein [Chloroflexota bacterium]